MSLIIIATWLVYWPALGGSILWDDDANITSPPLQSLHGLYRIWFDPSASSHAQYYPLVHTAFWLEHHLWGDSMLGYHLITLVWHSLSIVLVYLIVEKLNIPGALLAAAIFAVHPVMVESVAWVTEQKNTLSAVFYLASMLAYLGFDESRGRKAYFGTLALYALALLSKTAIVTLPASLLVIFWWQRGTLSWRRDVAPLVPFFVLGFAASLITMYVEWKLIGAEGTEFELTFVQRFLLSGRTVWFYLGKLFWPMNLTLMYPRWTIDPLQWWQWVYSLAAIAMTLLLWQLRRRTRAPLAAWLFFCLTLFPVMGFLNVYMFVYTFVADHFQYVASLGIIVFVAGSAVTALNRCPELARRTGAALCLMLLAVLAVLSWQQAGDYSNAIVHYQSILKINPDSWMAHTNLGLALSDMGQHEDALEHLRQAMLIKSNSAEIHNSLAGAFIQAGQAQKAIEAAQAALVANPNYVPAHNNLGVALMRLGRYPDAIKSLQQAVQLGPDFAAARSNLGAALANSGQLPEAIEQLTRSLEINPAQAGAHNDLGLVLVSSGRLKEAAEHFLAAVSLRPDVVDYRNNLAAALRDVGLPVQAIEQYQTVLQLDPNHVQTCFNLSQALAEVGRGDEAIATAKHALALATAAKNSDAIKQINDWLIKQQESR